MYQLPSRRRFLVSSAAAGLGLFTVSARRSPAAPAGGKLRVLSIGVTGTIGGTDRRNVASHPQAEITGLCDVDSHTLAQAAKDHPDAFTCRDYREAFEKHAEKFDAVIVATPDHSHAAIILTALAHDKHVYGQKPLVSQLAEVGMIERAMKAKPRLATLLGNQRMANIPRRLAVAALQQGCVGKIKSIHAWTSSGGDDHYFNPAGEYRENPAIPDHLDWDLWLNVAQHHPYCDKLAPRRWRSWWEFGTGGLGDWGCHLLDIPFIAFPEIGDALSVKSEFKESGGKHFHPLQTKAVIKYKADPAKFSGDTVEMHYYHPSLRPDPAELGLDEWPDGSNQTAFVGENGTFIVDAEGHSRLYRDGEVLNGTRLEGLPKLQPFNHWHSWIDKALGKNVKLITPFPVAVRITEAVLLGVRAVRFPGRELLWDGKALRFDLEEANRTIVGREYRKEFAPPRVG